MLKMVVFAVTFVVVQVAAGLIMFKLVWNKRFIKKCTKMGTEVAQEISEEMMDSDD